MRSIIQQYIVLLIICSLHLLVNSTKSAFASINYSNIFARHRSFFNARYRLQLSDDNAKDEARSLREKAEQLRKEVEYLEKDKNEDMAKKKLARDEEIEMQREIRLRYSAEVPILKGDGTEVIERCDFPPKMIIESGDDVQKVSRILTVQSELPLGLVLVESGEIPGATVVDEVVDGSNGEKTGVKVGDILRACTACQLTMDMPTWQLMAGGIGRPKTSRMMFSTDNRPFEEVMDAIVSNSMDPQGRPVWLVLERLDEK